MSLHRRLAAALALLALAGCRSTTTGRVGGAATAGAVLAANAVVVHIDDGDTIDVRIGGTTERVRLIGIDTPETKKPNTPVQCFGPEASGFTTAFLPIGTEVRLERDTEPRDPYRRLLAYVYRAADGAWLNLELARRGYARQLSIAPNTGHADELGAAVDRARLARVGLWGACPAFGSPALPAGTGAASRG